MKNLVIFVIGIWLQTGLQKMGRNARSSILFKKVEDEIFDKVLEDLL
jgi:hypothetical protein